MLTSASLRAMAGELRVMFGRNGVGKSTLLRIAAGLTAADGGSVHFVGECYVAPRLATLAAEGLFFLPDHDLLSPALSVRHNLELGGVTTTEGVHAGALWAPPDKWKLGVMDVAKLAPSAIRLFGRRLKLSLSVLAETDKVHPTQPHWYLGFLGTDPDHQGKGLGSAVLGPVLGRCDTEGIPAYLESSKEANVPFYERHGFAVTDTLDLDKGRGPRMWLMWREPRPPEPGAG